MEYHEIALGIATMLKKNRFQMKTSEKRKQTDCYNPPFPSQLCPSAAPPAEPLAQ
jgi:hypothetical protein